MAGSFALAGGDSGLPSCTGTCSWGGGTECRQAGGPGVACSYPTWLCFFSTGQQQGPQGAGSLSWSHSPVGLGFGTWTHLLPAPWLLGSPSRSLGLNPSSRKGWPPAATPHWVSRPPCRSLVRGHPASRHGLLPRARIGQEAVGVYREATATVPCPGGAVTWPGIVPPCPEVIFMGPWGMQAAVPCQRDR